MKIKILVCYHKPDIIIANDILQPILVGAKNATQETKQTLKELCNAKNVALYYDDSLSNGGGGVSSPYYHNHTNNENNKAHSIQDSKDNRAKTQANQIYNTIDSKETIRTQSIDSQSHSIYQSLESEDSNNNTAQTSDITQTLEINLDSKTLSQTRQNNNLQPNGTTDSKETQEYRESKAQANQIYNTIDSTNTQDSNRNFLQEKTQSKIHRTQHTLDSTNSTQSLQSHTIQDSDILSTSQTKNLADSSLTKDSIESYHHTQKQDSISQESKPNLLAPYSYFTQTYPQEISALNQYFCELTAIYWAWKNLDCDYYGLFHYRRILAFSDEVNDICYFGRYTYYPNPNDDLSALIHKSGLDSKNLDSIISQYDIIVPCGWYDDIYKNYQTYHNIQDLENAIKIIQHKYPQMQDSLNNIHHIKCHFANMFVMKKKYYFEYCEWLFDVLFTLMPQVPLQYYNAHQARIFGYLSERLFSVWIHYKRNSDKNLKIAEYPMVFLRKYDFHDRITNLDYDVNNLLTRVQQLESIIKKKKPWFGWQKSGEYKRFYLLKIRIYKKKL